jgi:hypothetical protein
MAAKFKMRLRAGPFVCGKRILDESSSLRQGTL